MKRFTYRSLVGRSADWNHQQIRIIVKIFRSFRFELFTYSPK